MNVGFRLFLNICFFLLMVGCKDNNKSSEAVLLEVSAGIDGGNENESSKSVDFDAINLFVSTATTHIINDTESEDDSEGDENNKIIANLETPLSISLTDFNAETITELFDLEPGNYKHIHLLVDSLDEFEDSVLIGEDDFPLVVRSGELKIVGRFLVDDEGKVMIEALDLEDAVTEKTKNDEVEYILRPTIKITKNNDEEENISDEEEDQTDDELPETDPKNDVINLYISSISTNLKGGGRATEIEGASIIEANFEEPVMINLEAFNGDLIKDKLNLPEGTYRNITLDINTEDEFMDYIIRNNEQYTLEVNSKMLKIIGEFSVDANGDVEIKPLDLSEAVRERMSPVEGGEMVYYLQPTIKLIGNTQ